MIQCPASTNRPIFTTRHYNCVRNTLARLGDRTVVDALAPFCAVLRQMLSLL
ncbi:hypothetical protein BDR05DRAFT_1063408 [Suillus weaverae]|nr:hypothetical protein BDR05DRAFT_1063408 [Suillus weaverae]